MTSSSEKIVPTHRTRSHLLAPVRTCPHLFAPDDAIVVDVDASASRPSEFDDRFRLYLDESGDHVFREVVEPAHRFLCLLGCWFQNPAYLKFSDELETLKRKFLPHHPDNPVVLHREDILNARREFKSLRDPAIRAAWDQALLDVIGRADFRIVAVVIDKLALRSAYGDDAAHPYHLALGFMLQRYAGYRAVNTVMVQAYWQVGRLIVEDEQAGRQRATYGDAVLEELSRRLTTEFGRGFDVTNLRKMRQFYRMFAIRDALRLESVDGGRPTVKPPSGSNPVRSVARDDLTWSHYRLLMQLESASARDWYMQEAATERWSTRQLERQISVLYYERLLASRQKAPVRREAKAKLAEVEPEQFIRDPYVLEFLDLKDYPGLRD